ncbi:MAG: hypothetical protein OEM26_12810, partial [Saprospiraceae bacterium]|nr:hypothetical protein [Saprospiraceae bacterium]
MISNLRAQIQLDVQGSNTTGDNVVGKWEGVYGFGASRTGVYGESTSGTGIRGISENHYGGYFLNNDKMQPDLVIGGNNPSNPGDDCVIASDPQYPGSDLFLRSNDAVVVELDHDLNEEGHFEVRNGSTKTVLSVNESGLAHLHALVFNDYARHRLNNIDNMDYWDIAAEAAGNQDLNFFRSGVGNLLQLHSSGNPLTTATGAYLSSGGMWTNSSSATLRDLEDIIDPREILAAVSKLTLYKWRYKSEPESIHLGPTAEDFYHLFNCGKSDKHLACSDLAAVAMASVQALYQD